MRLFIFLDRGVPKVFSVRYASVCYNLSITGNFRCVPVCQTRDEIRSLYFCTI